MDYVALIDCAEMLGKGDASVAWNFANLASHHWMLACSTQCAGPGLGQGSECADRIFLIFPAGRAQRSKAVSLTRCWPSPAVGSCQWNMLASVVFPEDEADGIAYRIFLLQQERVQASSTPGTRPRTRNGLQRVEVNDAVVPDALSVAVNDLAGGPTPGSVVNPNAHMRLPAFSVFPYVLSGVALAMRGPALDVYIDVARHRASTYNRVKLGDMQSTQIKIAGETAQDRCCPPDPCVVELH